MRPSLTVTWSRSNCTSQSSLGKDWGRKLETRYQHYVLRGQAGADNDYAQLLDKQPAPPPDRDKVPDTQPTVAVQVTETYVLRAVRPFPAGSAAGPDGVRPQHILEMANCREAGPELHSALTGFVNCLLHGEIHPLVSPVLFGDNLIALVKKTDGIRRPTIAVGYSTLRRIAAKCANTYAASQLPDYFSPIQLRVVTSAGCEAAVHATRRFTKAMPDGHAVVKIDFRNGFNSLRIDVMLCSVASSSRHLPVLPSLL